MRGVLLDERGTTHAAFEALAIAHGLDASRLAQLEVS